MAKKTFESALARLEQIITELEDGEPGLDKSLKKFDEGIELITFCNKQLEAARQRVDALIKKDGSLKTIDFAEDQDGDQELSE